MSEGTVPPHQLHPHAPWPKGKKADYRDTWQRLSRLHDQLKRHGYDALGARPRLRAAFAGLELQSKKRISICSD